MDEIKINQLINQLSEKGTETINKCITAYQKSAIINLIILLIISLIFIMISIALYKLNLDELSILIFSITVIINIICAPLIIKSIYMWYTYPEASFIEYMLNNI